MASSNSLIPFTFVFFIRLVEKLTPSGTTPMPAVPPGLTNLLSLPALLPLSLRLVAAFFRFLISEGRIFLPVPLNSASSSFPVIFSYVLRWQDQCHDSETDRLDRCRGERSPAKCRDHNSELYVYGGYVEFVDEFCYGDPVILDCNIASGVGAEEWGWWGTHEVTLFKIVPPSSITAANTSSLEVTFLKTGRIGITGKWK